MTGSIRDYTTNFKFIIPEFNIATWHDYIEQNFRSIDALFHNLFGINGFSGIWKTNSQYTAGQVLFVGEDGGSMYEGRLLKIVNDTNTGGFSTFSEAIEANPKDYELYADASSAQIFSELARDWANKTNGTVKTPEGDDTGEYSAKKYAQDSHSSATDAEHFRLLAETDKNIALEAAVSAETSAQNSETSAQNALVSEQNASVSEQNAKSSEDNAKVYETNAANSVETQTNNFNSYNNQLLSTTSVGVSEIIDTKIASIDEIGSTLSEALNEINLKTDVLDKTMITNCLTHIPQDIKLELNNGTLTLKAGSKVYVPNGKNADGSNRFDEVVLTKDYTRTASGTTTVSQTLFFQMDDDDRLTGLANGSFYSGDTKPTSPVVIAMWYDTANNVIKRTDDGGSTWNTYGIALPLCIFTITNGVITSIDQTFNGFGYIGSTVFALPGVRGLIPNGRNADGSLKNVEFINNIVRTTTITTAGSYNVYLSGSNFYVSSVTAYDEDKNYNYGTANKDIRGVCRVGEVATDSSKQITSFIPKTTFQAADVSGGNNFRGRNDFHGETFSHFVPPWAAMDGHVANTNWVANAVFNRFTHATQISSGYVTPQVGFLAFRAGGNNRTSYCDCNANRVFESNWSNSYGSPDNCYIPVGAGVNITFSGLSKIYFFYCGQ